MPTILSRVRTYSFANRNATQQNDVINRVFHVDDFNGTIEDFLLTFLPVSPEVLRQAASKFLCDCASGQIPDLQEIIKNCGNFDPRVMLKIFLDGISYKVTENALLGQVDEDLQEDPRFSILSSLIERLSNIESQLS